MCNIFVFSSSEKTKNTEEEEDGRCVELFTPDVMGGHKGGCHLDMR